MLRLGPRDAVHGLVGVVADGADGVALGLARRVALVALKAALDDRARLPQVALRAALDQGHAGGEAHPVDVAARVDVVEAVEHDVEGAEEVEGELWRLDVAVRRLDRELLAVRELEHRLPRDLGLGAADVLGAEEELAVEVGVVDRVEVHHRDVLDPGQDLRATRCGGAEPGREGVCSEGGRHTKFLTSSQPMPPAPTTKTLTAARSVPVSSLVCATLAEGSSRARFKEAMRRSSRCRALRATFGDWGGLQLLVSELTNRVHLYSPLPTSALRRTAFARPQKYQPGLRPLLLQPRLDHPRHWRHRRRAIMLTVK